MWEMIQTQIQQIQAAVSHAVGSVQGVTDIIRDIDQITANAASASWQLSADEFAEVNKILEG